MRKQAARPAAARAGGGARTHSAGVRVGPCSRRGSATAASAPTSSPSRRRCSSSAPARGSSAAFLRHCSGPAAWAGTGRRTIARRSPRAEAAWRCTGVRCGAAEVGRGCAAGGSPGPGRRTSGSGLAAQAARRVQDGERNGAEEQGSRAGAWPRRREEEAHGPKQSGGACGPWRQLRGGRRANCE